MIIGVPKEIAAGERRVALTPEIAEKLVKAKHTVMVEMGAGESAGFADDAYKQKGAWVEQFALQLISSSDIILKVQPPTTNSVLGRHEVDLIKERATLIAFLQPYSNLDTIKRLAQRKITSFAMEFMPRITRAQSMDALSSMSTVAGYKAVILAANSHSKLFPLMMTAAGTIAPLKVFIIGAGVAGLQAIATAKRLGAVVEAYDTRPAVKEQVQSLGARFLEIQLETKDAQDKGGYAKAQTDEFYQKQREFMTKVVASTDVVITTALVPGKKAPVLITADMVKQMRNGSVIVDLAAEQGGNCELTEKDKETEKHGVKIIGYTNLPSMMPTPASQMYSRNISNFLLHLCKDGKLNLDLNDELTRAPMVTHEGEIMHEPTKAALAATAQKGGK